MKSILTIPAEVARALHAFGVQDGHTVVSAYSTGPDSTALLVALCRLRSRLGIEVVAAYFDHGLRRQRVIELEIAHARATSDLLRVPLRVGVIGQADTGNQGGPEAVSREARYRFLEQLSGECGADWIAVGHTADDRAETVLMRALQGVGVAGLGGMPAQRGRIVRPLLALRRGDLRNWLNAEHLPFRRDRQNDDQRFTRNQVRRMLRVIERRFPDATDRLAQVGRQAESTQRFVAGRAASEIPWKPTPFGIAVSWQLFKYAPLEVQREALYQGYDRLFHGTGHRRLPGRFLFPLLQAVARGDERVRIEGHGVIVERARADLIMSRAVVPGYRTSYLWRAVRSGSYKIPEANIEIRRVDCIWSERHRAAVTKVQLGAIDGPLLVRSRRPGDEIQLQSGATPLGELLREWGAPASQRWKIPVVADNRGVLAVCGAVFGYRDAISTCCADGENIGTCAAIEICRVEEES